MSVDTQASRVNVLLRLVGILFLALGVALVYLTYTETDLVAQITPVFYLGGWLLIVVGFVALIAKYT